MLLPPTLSSEKLFMSDALAGFYLPILAVVKKNWTALNPIRQSPAQHDIGNTTQLG